MTQPKIYIDSQPAKSLEETSLAGKNGVRNDSSSSSNEPVRTPESNENGSQPNIPLEDLNNLLGSPAQGMLHNYTSFEGSDDELSQLTNSNSINHHADRSNGSISDTQSPPTEKIDVKKSKKQKKKNRIGQMISGVTHKSKSELFQKLFKDMAPEEVLVSDYSCALQRDILVHGRLYLSQTWLCFYANIFGWETLVTIRWDNITAITKEKTAKLIPNAIQVFTDTDKYFFSTFVTREHAYTALFRIWQNALLGQPMLPTDLKHICRKSTKTSRDAVDGVPINEEPDETGDEMMEYDDDKSFVSTSESIANSANGGGDGISVFSGVGSLPYEVSSGSAPNGKSHSDSVNSSNSNDNVNSIRIPANTSSPTIVNGNEENENNSKPLVDTKVSTLTPESKKNTDPSSSPIPKTPLNLQNRKVQKTKHKHQRYPSYHLKLPPVEGESTTDDNDSEEEPVIVEPDDDILCPCHDAHAGKEYVNEEFNFDVDALYEHLFSQESDMMKRVFKQRKFENTKYTPYKRETDGSYFQVLSYTIPLNYSIGPKQCSTVTKQMMQKENLPGSFYIIKTESTTVGVPYGDSFYVKTQYCITRASGNRSRLRITTEITYTKRVFGLVKNMISRGTDEAFKDYINFLVNILKSESDLLSYKEVKMTKTKLKKTKSNESAKSIHQREIPRKEKVPVSQLKSHPTTVLKKTVEADHLPAKKGSLRGFAIMLVLLFLMNIYMLSRLRSLEKTVLVSKGDWLPKELPSTKEEWNNLLEYQKSLHDLELYKLKEVIGNTASLLEQVQLSIKSLHDDIERSIVDGRPNPVVSKLDPVDEKTSDSVIDSGTDKKDEL